MQMYKKGLLWGSGDSVELYEKPCSQGCNKKTGEIRY